MTRISKQQVIEGFLVYKNSHIPNATIKESWERVELLRKAKVQQDWVKQIEHDDIVKAFNLDEPDHIAGSVDQVKAEAEDFGYVLDHSIVKHNAQLEKSLRVTRINSGKNSRNVKELALEIERISKVRDFWQEQAENASKRDYQALLKFHESPKSSHKAIIQLSDTHFGSVISSANNMYDLEIAGRRLQMFADKAKKHMAGFNVKDVVIAGTGDFFNKNILLEKRVTNTADNNTLVKYAVELMSKFILDINQEFNITFTGVIGNESRQTEDMPNSDRLYRDNFDYNLYEYLKTSFNNQERIKVIQDDSIACLEKVISINGLNVLLMHGHQMKGKVPKTSIDRVKIKYAERGTKIDLILCGHIHETLFVEGLCRSASLCGTDEYADKSLHCSGKASQNLILIGNDKSVDKISIETHNVGAYQGYELSQDLLDLIYDTPNKSKKVSQKDSLIELGD